MDWRPDDGDRPSPQAAATGAAVRSEERFRALVDHFTDAFFLLDEQCTILDVNRQACADLGYGRDELVGMAAARLGGGAVPVDLCALAGELGHEETVSLEATQRRRDGSTFPVELRLRLLIEQGQRRVICLARDITERRRAELELRTSEARYRAVVEDQTEFIVRWRPDGTRTFVNDAYVRYFGQPREALIGTSFLPLIPSGEERDALQRRMAAVSPAQPIMRNTHQSRRADGALRWQEWIDRALFDADGHVVEWQSVGRDVHDRMVAEESLRTSQELLRQAQKMEAIGRLAAGVAHDFNNLLTVICSYSELVRREPGLSDDAQEMLTEISTAGVRANRLTSQLLAFGRKQVLQPSVVDLGRLITETGRMLERLIGEDVVLTIGVAPDLWPIRVDGGQIEQVLVNLSVNARDAMPQGGQLTIEARNREVSADDAAEARLDAGRWVELSVGDSGVGMDEATQQRMFEPFFTTKAVGKGTGLGLAMVHGVVEQSGGVLHLDSRVGEGTRFTLYFPAVTDAEPVSAPVRDRGAMPHGTETVMVVEDEKVLRTLMVSALRRLGYTVLDVPSPEAAIRLFADRLVPLHLLVTDVVMPGMSGVELADRARALHPDLKCLFVSGYTDDEVLRRGVLHGEVDFLAKPFTPGVLADKVREVLDGQRR